MKRILRRCIVTDSTPIKEYVEIACLSTDTPPTSGIITGSICIEVDTGKVFFFNEASETWEFQFSFQE